MNNTNYEEYVGYKLVIFPAYEQTRLFYEYFCMCASVYNLGINIEEAQKYSDDKKFLKFFDLNNKVNEIKHNDPNYYWLNNYDATTIKIILRDVVYAYEMFFNGLCNYPVYKDIRYPNQQFPIRSDRLEINETFIRIPSIGFVSYYNTYGEQIIGNGDKNNKNCNYLKYTDSRISFDGINYYISFSLPKDENHNINSYKYFKGNPEWDALPFNDAIGIDIGLRNEKWLVDSTGTFVERPDSTKLRNRISRLNNKLNRQYATNIEKGIINDNKQSTKNMEKTKQKIKKDYNKIKNRRKNEVYEYTNYLLNQKPKAVVFESIAAKDLSITNENKQCNFEKQNRNNQLNDAAIYESTQIIKRKLEANGIPVIYAEEGYPSSQICSNCGYRQNIGRSKIYKCPNCGLEIDRDINAAKNLANLIK